MYKNKEKTINRVYSTPNTPKPAFAVQSNTFSNFVGHAPYFLLLHRKNVSIPCAHITSKLEISENIIGRK